MLDLPKSTEFNRRIPKQKFYDNLTVTPTLKRVFIDQIKIIYWRNKIAASTVNLASGQAVTEIEVFEIQLNQPSLDEAVLKLIDKEIPYHILFLLTYGGRVQAWIGYKEAAGSGTSAFKVKIAGDALDSPDTESLKESVDRSAKRAELEKKIAALEVKIRREKQLNRQLEMTAKLHALKKEMLDI